MGRPIARLWFAASTLALAACASVLGFPDRVLDDGDGGTAQEGGTVDGGADVDAGADVVFDAGPAKAAISPTAVDFGLVSCGAAAPADQTITITNAGGAPLTWAVTIDSSPDFALHGAAGGTIQGGQSATVNVGALPIDPLAGPGDTAQTTVTITTTDPDKPSVQIPVKLAVGGGSLTVVPLTASFGETPVSVSASDVPVVLTNTGNQPVTVGFGAPTSAVFTLTCGGAACPASQPVAPGASIPALVAHFTPTATQAYNATSAITVTGPTCGTQPTAITFDGTGISGFASVQPGALDFGLVDCGTTAAAKTIQIHNSDPTNAFTYAATFASTGTATSAHYTISSASGSVPNKNTAGSCGNGCTTVTITPTAIGTTADITPNAFGDRVDFTTTATGDNGNIHSVDLLETAHGAILQQSTGAIDFGSVLVSAPATSNFNVSNVGNASATISYQTSPAEFTMFPQNQVVTAGTNYQGTIRFAPTAAQAYTGTAQMQITGVTCGPVPGAIALTGNGALSAQVNPTSVNFGNVNCGATGTAQTVTLTNTSGADFTWSAATAPASSYAAPNPTSGTLKNGKSVVITITPKAIPTTSSTAADGFAGTLTITTVPALESPYVASLHMTAQGVVLAFSTTAINFPTTRSGRQSKQTFSVVNNGNISAAVTLTLGGPNANQFSLQSTTATVAGGGSQGNTATFSPTSTGTKNADVSLSIPGTTVKCAPLPDGGAATGLTLTGTGN